MKKISVLLIFVMLFMQMTVFAQTSPIQVSIEQVGEAMHVTAIVPSASGNPERMTIQVFDAQNNILHMRETSNCEETAEGYKYTFSPFRFRNGTPTGTYTFIVGGGGLTRASVHGEYTSMRDLVEAMKKIDEAQTVSDLTAALITHPYGKNAGLTVDQYATFDDFWKTKVNDPIVQKDYGTALLSDDDYTGFLEARDILEEDFNEFVDLALICGAGTTEETAAALLANKEGNLNHSEFVARLSNMNYVADRMKERNYTDVNFYDDSKDVIQTFFDGAVVTAVLNQLDWGFVCDALTYYEQQGLFVLDRTNLDLLEDVSEAYTELKYANITDYTLIPGKFAEIIQSLYRQQQAGNNNNQSSNIFGGGGGVIGGSGSSTPSKPEQEQKPNEEVIKPVEPDKVNVFSDISEYVWAEDAILELAKRGIINGVGDGKFMPGASIKREEAVKMVVEAFELTGDAKTSFNDVTEESWFGEFVSVAVANGIISGIGENEFGAGINITRQDMAVLVYRALELKKSELPNTEKDFEDADNISDYAKSAVNTLKAMGILKGYDDGTFAPKSYMSRAEFACMMYSVIELF